MRINVLNRPLFDSFLGIIDIKQGAILIILFGLLNKVAGVYGLLGFLTAGGSLSQLSYYLYSTLSLAAFILGLRAISDEQSLKVHQFAHFFIADHLLGTFYTLLFAVNWWVYVKHDGERLVNGEAQKAMIELAISRGEVGGEELSVEERAKIALALWGSEKAFAVAVLVACWVLKIYFSLVLYSFSAHLRQNTYRALPLTTTPLASHSSHTVPIQSSNTDPTSKRQSRHALLSRGEAVGEEEFKWDSDDDEGEGREGRAERGEGGRV